MPKRSISAFRPTGIESGKRFYSDDDVDAIILAVGGLPDGEVAQECTYDDGTGAVVVHVDRRTALVDHLEMAARRWHTNLQWQAKPTKQQRKTAFEKIEKTADKLLDAMHLPVQPDKSDVSRAMPNALRFGGLQVYAAKEAERLGGIPEQSGGALLENCIWSVYQLRDWARDAKERYASLRATPRHERHTRDAALGELLDNLANIHIDIFYGGTGTSVSTVEGKAGGPFVRFIEACLRPLPGDKMLSTKAIQRKIQRQFPPPKSTPKKT